MNTVTKCLFGGALIGAGLCSSAAAGDIQWGSSIASNNKLRTTSGLPSDFAISGNWNESVTGPLNQNASSIGTDMGISMLAYSDATLNGSGYAYARHYSGVLDFTVSQDMMVYFDWDVSNDNFNLSYLAITDTTPSGSLFFMNSSLALETGTASAMAYAGETYFLSGWIIAGGGLTGSSYFNMTGSTITVVPLPPAALAGLGLLAGMGAYRRIRR